MKRGLKIWLSIFLSWAMLVLTYFLISEGFETEKETGVMLLISVPPISFGLSFILLRWALGATLLETLKGSSRTGLFVFWMLALTALTIHSTITTVNLLASIEDVGSTVEGQEAALDDIASQLNKIEVGLRFR
jgi:hypothetical protein